MWFGIDCLGIYFRRCRAFALCIAIWPCGGRVDASAAATDDRNKRGPWAQNSNSLHATKSRVITTIIRGADTMLSSSDRFQTLRRVIASTGVCRARYIVPQKILGDHIRIELYIMIEIRCITTTTVKFISFFFRSLWLFWGTKWQ